MAVLFLVGFAVLCVVVGVAAPGRTRIDSDGASSLHRFVLDRPGLASVLRLIGQITSPWWLRLVAAVAALLLYLKGRSRAALWLLVTMAAGGALGSLLKLVFERSRPVWPDPIAAIGGYSFPSGHATNSMLAAACAVVLLDPTLRGATSVSLGAGGGIGPRVRIAARSALWLLAGGFVLLVGFDRVGLGVHFVTDVLAGWSLALATVFATLAWFDREHHPQPRSPVGPTKTLAKQRFRGPNGRSSGG